MPTLETPFGQLAEEFLTHQRVYIDDPETCAFNLRILCRHFGPMLLTQIGPREIETFIAARLAKGRARATVNRQRSTLSRFFNWAILRGYHAGPNPVRQVRRFRESPGRTRYLTAEDSSRLVLAASHHLKPIIITALNTGGRLREILTLTWADVDLERGLIYFRRERTKSRRERQIPVTPELAAALRRLRPGAPDQPVFEYNGRELTSVRTSFMRACRKAGLVGLRFHDLRHGFASAFMMNGGNIFVLQRLLGHSTISLTQRYSHLSPQFLQEAVRFMGTVRPSGPGRQEQQEP